MKRILITGKESYIGTSFERWVAGPPFAGVYQVDTLDMREAVWKEKDFSGYDTVFHVAGMAHADIGKVTEEQKNLYYRVNCDLAVETARKAKREGVFQFIYMSSIIIYGEGTSIREKRVITRDTKPMPSNFYGDSKWKAEQKLENLRDEAFRVAILRPPMIYGEGCKGNYQVLINLARILPVFPDFPNQRSVLEINNLCEFIRSLINSGEGGLYFPRDLKCVKTSELVRCIALGKGWKIWITPVFNGGVYLIAQIPGKMGQTINKAFGSLIYDIKDM